MARLKFFFSTAIISSAGIILGCASTSQLDGSQPTAPVANQLSGTAGQGDTANVQAESSPSAAQKTAEKNNPPVDEHVTELKDKNKIICRREKLTGTRFPRRICMTVVQREEMARESQQWLNSGGFDGNVQSVQDGLVDPGGKRR